MPVDLRESTAHLRGALDLDDVEPLVTWLEDTENPRVSLRRCTGMHAAVVQVLLTCRPALASEPADPMLRDLLAPLR